VGVYDYQTCIDYGLTGVMARSVGIKRDLRTDKLETYGNYYFLNFRSYLGHSGDSYDRFLIRMNEMLESLNIINQIINKLVKIKPKHIKKNIFSEINSPQHITKFLTKNKQQFSNQTSPYTSMENLIEHFKY